MAWAFWLYLLNAVLMLIVAVREARRPALALNYLVVGLVLPVLGFVLYLIVSRRTPVPRERLTFRHEGPDALPQSLSQPASTLAQSLQKLSVGGTRAGRVEVLTNGMETYGRILQSVKNAKKTIDLEYYIYRNDKIGSRLTDVLVERAKAGVEVRFVRDGWGSRQIPQSQIRRMMDAGIDCRTFFPLRFPWFLSTFNHRDHCKIVVVDGEEAYTGGINVGDEYAGWKPKTRFWRDTHVRLMGEVQADLQAIFNVHWAMATPERASRSKRQRQVGRGQAPMPNPGQGHPSRNFPTYNSAALSPLSTELGAELGHIDIPDRSMDTETWRGAHIQTFEGNPLLSTQVIRQVYFTCLTQATKTIDITTPYFVPDADIIMAIKTAVARGVRVRLLVPHHVDQRIVGHASLTYYSELVEAGVHVYLYNKGTLHAKVMTIDEEIAEIGAANYDLRSFRFNYEICEIIYSADVVRDLTDQFEQDLKDSILLSVEDVQQRSGPQRILEQGSRLLAPLL